MSATSSKIISDKKKKTIKLQQINNRHHSIQTKFNHKQSTPYNHNPQTNLLSAQFNYFHFSINTYVYRIRNNNLHFSRNIDGKSNSRTLPTRPHDRQHLLTLISPSLTGSLQNFPRASNVFSHQHKIWPSLNRTRTMAI